MDIAERRDLRVLIVDDHPLIRTGIKAMLSQRPSLSVCAEAETGQDALRLAHTLRPDLVILDYALPVLNGLEVTRQLCRDLPDIGVLIYTMHTDERVLAAAVQAGARGYVLKTEEDAALLAAIDASAAGRSHVSAALGRPPLGARPKNELHMLTPREIEVIRLVATGATNRAIADRLNVSIKTVDTHRTSAMRKLDLHTAIDMTIFAIRSGIINL